MVAEFPCLAGEAAGVRARHLGAPGHLRFSFAASRVLLQKGLQRLGEFAAGPEDPWPVPGFTPGDVSPKSGEFGVFLAPDLRSQNKEHAP
jgi:hypothetical protein